MKIGVTMLLLLVIVAVIVTAKKSSGKSKSSDSAKTAHKYSSKKVTKTYTKTKKPSSKDAPSYSKSQKASKSRQDEPEVSKARYQSKRQEKVHSEHYVYEEEPVAATCEGSCAGEADWQQGYKKAGKGSLKQCNCPSCRQYEEACPDPRSPAVSQEVRSAGSCPCPNQQPHPSAPCQQVPAASCPYAAQPQPCPVVAPPCSPSQPPAVGPCPWASGSLPPTPPQAPAGSLPPPTPAPAQGPPQAYPTININTYSSAPLVPEAKPVNETEAVVEEEVVEEDDEQEEEVMEGEADPEGDEDEQEAPSKTNKYASCANPELSEQMDDGYCYRSEL